MWRFKTKEEFIADGLWRTDNGKSYPENWNMDELMNKYLGTEIPKKHHSECEIGASFRMEQWKFTASEYTNVEQNYEIY